VTGALDPELAGEVVGVMRDLTADGMTTRVVTDEMGVAHEAGDRTVLLADGEVVDIVPSETFVEGSTPIAPNDSSRGCCRSLGFFPNLYSGLRAEQEGLYRRLRSSSVMTSAPTFERSSTRASECRGSPACPPDDRPKTLLFCPCGREAPPSEWRTERTGHRHRLVCPDCGKTLTVR
jgi:hypothetical protein